MAREAGSWAQAGAFPSREARETLRCLPLPAAVSKAGKASEAIVEVASSARSSAQHRAARGHGTWAGQKCRQAEAQLQAGQPQAAYEEATTK